MTITTSDVVRAAKLAKLDIPEKEIKIFLTRISKVLHWVEKLQEIDVRNIQPLANPMEDRDPYLMDSRPDSVTDGNCVQDILKNAPSKEYDMFEVPKVIE